MSEEKHGKSDKNNREDKKGIGMLISEQLKSKWTNFAKENDFSTLSKLIREAVNFYIEYTSKNKFIKSLSEISHDIKESLTSIQGFSELIIKDNLNLDSDMLFRIKEVHLLYFQERYFFHEFLLF